MPTLFDPLSIGSLTLGNRIVMAPLTRARAGADRIPNAMMAEYYAQRASAGLILSEATSVTPMGVGYADTPGIRNDAQVEGWKLVTKAVHDAGGLIFLQLWHVGRISDPLFLDGELPVAPSAIKPAGTVSLVRPKKEYETPRALETDEIAGIVEAYRQGAENAKRAGFDGVEIHGANGYLIDQFLQDRSNRRTDQYGGPIENRVRFLEEITDAVTGVWARIAWACTWRRAAMVTTWATAMPARCSPMWRAGWASAAWPSCACANTSAPTACWTTSRRLSAGWSLPMKT